VRLLLKKQHPVKRQPHSATILKRWRGEESPSVLRRRGCQSARLLKGLLRLLVPGRLTLWDCNSEIAC
ncbi:MAG: hypothetical protein EWV48_20750, partial [Microcystis aeruginosa Ma_QC_C_20070823_S13]